MPGPRDMTNRHVETDPKRKGRESSIVNGLAVGQSRFLDRDLLRDDQLRLKRFCHVQKVLGRALCFPRKEKRLAHGTYRARM